MKEYIITLPEDMDVNTFCMWLNEAFAERFPQSPCYIDIKSKEENNDEE